MKSAFLRALPLCALLALSTFGRDAIADASAADRAAARALFDQGRTLTSQGKYAEACPKFEESQRLDPGIGTQFNLADCFERTGRTATAWAMFLDVASAARQAGQKDREKVARARAAALDPKLSRLSVTVAEEAPGLEVKRDGSSMGKALWGTAVPVDPGTHTIEASAPGRKPWVQKIEVPATATETKVSIPALEPEAAAPEAPVPTNSATAPVASAPPPLPAAKPPAPSATAPAPIPEQPSNPGSTQRIAGWIVGGAGLVGLGVAGFLTLGAKSKADDAKPYCVSDTECVDPEGVRLRDDAIRQANIATIVGGIGAAALVGGVVLYLTAPSASSSAASATRAAPALAIGPNGFLLKGAF